MKTLANSTYAIAKALFLMGAIAVAGPFHHTLGDEDYPERKMPAIELGYKVPVRPGEQVKISAEFHGSKANCVQIFDQADGKYVKVWGKSGGEPFISIKNTSTETRIFLLVSRRKDRDVPSEPWKINQFKVLDDGMATGDIKVGWEDEQDGVISDN